MTLMRVMARRKSWKETMRRSNPIPFLSLTDGIGEEGETTEWIG